MARELWLNPRAALGKRIRDHVNDKWSEVIGVVADLRDNGINQPAPTIVYWPVAQKFVDGQVRVSRNVDKRSLARTSLTLVLLGIAGSMALLLGTVGIYGVIAYSVSLRTRDIGIRIALGSSTSGVTRLFVVNGFLLSCIGAFCRLCVALALTRLMKSLLFGVSPVDPVTYGAVLCGLIFTALLASWLPARRAASVDPIEALRAQ